MPDPTSETSEPDAPVTPEDVADDDAPDERRRPSRSARLLLAVLFGVGMKKKRRKKRRKPSKAKKAKKPKAPAEAGEEAAPGDGAAEAEATPAEAPEKKPAKKRKRRTRRKKLRKPRRTPQQIARARRLRSRVWSGIALALVLGVGGGVGGWYLWTHWATVPDLIGMSQEQARSVLESHGLSMGVINQTFVGDEGQFPTGTVVAHAPGYDARVAPGTPVAVTVVAGPAWVRMAKVTGLTVGQAVALLGSLEMTVSVVDPVTHVQPASSYLHGMGFRVTSSTVPPGARVERGMMVMLSVDRKVADAERRFVFGHPNDVAEKGLEYCYQKCHQERECSRCHLRVLGDFELPPGITAADLVRDQALEFAGPRTDAGTPRFVRVEKLSDTAYEVVLNADSAPSAERRAVMLSATMRLFDRLLGHAGVEELTVKWLDAKTRRTIMTVRMTKETLWSNKWSGLAPDQLPAIADYFAE